MLAIVGTLLGVLIGFAGQFLIQWRLNTWQREQWIRDSKKAEWRELIGTLCQSALVFLNNLTPIGYMIEMKHGEEERELYEADSEARKTIQDRLFIAERVQEEKILERWQIITAGSDGSKFENGWNDLHAALVKAAKDDLKM